MRNSGRPRAGGFLASLLLVASAALAAEAPTGEVWITLAEDAFASATHVFKTGPDLAALPRIAQVGDVVLTRIPRSGLEALSARIHEDHRRCGGFVQHANLADALATINRLRAPRRAPEGLPFAIDRPDVVTPLLSTVDEAQILSSITALSSFPNRFHQWALTHNSHLWIRDLWIGYAAQRPDVTVELYSHGGLTPQPSVILTIPGNLHPDEVVVIGAHQDSIRSTTSCSGQPSCTTSSVNCVAPGADDDASGIATISEVIRVALAGGFVPQRTVKFMAYAAEEVGLVGSRNIAQAFAAAGTNVVAALQQDMTGYTDSATVDVALITDAAYTNPALNAFLGDLLDTYTPALTWTTTTCGYACSDHAAWDENGFPAAFAFEAPFGDHSPFIHRCTDTVASLGGSAAHAANFARLATAFLVETALDLEPEIFADGFESEDTAAWSVTAP